MKYITSEVYRPGIAATWNSTHRGTSYECKFRTLRGSRTH